MFWIIVNSALQVSASNVAIKRVQTRACFQYAEREQHRSAIKGFLLVQRNGFCFVARDYLSQLHCKVRNFYANNQIKMQKYAEKVQKVAKICVYY